MRATEVAAMLRRASKRRFAALAGVIGPAAFVSAWTVSAALTDREHSSIDDTTSHLDAVGAHTRPTTRPLRNRHLDRRLSTRDRGRANRPLA